VLISTVNFQFDVFAKVRCTHGIAGVAELMYDIVIESKVDEKQ
jgi:hypothetical protein